MSAQWSVWLLPSAVQLDALTAVVERLAPVFGEPVFVPHATIQGDVAMDLQALCAAVHDLAKSHPVCRWRMGAVEHSPHFFRCLYLRLQEDGGFSSLQRVMQAATGVADGLSPFPHVSLAYGQMNPQGLAWVQALQDQFVGQDLVLDQLAVYRSSKQVPIAEWACVARYPLQAVV
jgi:hypothetical protein